MSTLTEFRTFVQVTLEAELGIPFESGKIDGPVEDRSVGCVWSAGKREWAQDVNLEEILVQARVFRQWKQQQGLQNPELSELETLAEEVQLALKPVQTAAGPWQFRLTEIEIDLETNGIEATISALQANLFAIGG